MELKDKNILIIGGTGSFGRAYTLFLLDQHPELNKILIYSRDEQKQYEFTQSLLPDQRSKVCFYIGDIRDPQRLNEVMSQADIVIHAAAMKHLPVAEMNPMECVKTNILGTQNIVDAAIYNDVEIVVALSTDKAVLPINVYGSSKFFLEKLIIDGNINPKNHSTKLCAVRYANVLGSRGSVVPFFLKKRKSGTLPITDMGMTRFSITMDQGIDIVHKAMQNAIGGEIFIPKTASYKIETVAKAICLKCKTEVTGIRHGEKLSELLISKYESSRTIDCEAYYIVTPDLDQLNSMDFIKSHNGKFVKKGFEYDSETNTSWLSIEELKDQISQIPN